MAVMRKTITVKIPPMQVVACMMEITMGITSPGTEVHNTRGLRVNNRMAGLRELGGW